MPPPFSDVYHLRRVAESASKACSVCYKPTSAVLISSDGKADYFYVCEVHLKDPSFATAQVDPEVEAAKAKKVLLDKEIEALKVEWENRKKKKNKDDKKEESSDNKDDKNPEANATAAELQTLNELISKPQRTFILNKDIYNIRLQNHRNAQRAKQTATMLKKPTLFPKAPTHIPGSKSEGSPDT